ncbi:Uncharacterised protein [Chlamydia trachomatis]|nr:Uncharacterised protein [Chlamydia trachomatis]
MFAICSDSLNVLAPIGIIINSWKSIVFEACSPPLITFNIGTGKLKTLLSIFFREAKYSYNGFLLSIAAAFAHAKETAKIAFAPNFDLVSVPSA